MGPRFIALGPVIKSGIRHPRKKGKKAIQILKVDFLVPEHCCDEENKMRLNVLFIILLFTFILSRPPF